MSAEQRDVLREAKQKHHSVLSDYRMTWSLSLVYIYNAHYLMIKHQWPEAVPNEGLVKVTQGKLRPNIFQLQERGLTNRLPNNRLSGSRSSSLSHLKSCLFSWCVCARTCVSEHLYSSH